MGYVPAQKHDLFFSYAHGDDPEWIKGFCTSLHLALTERLGVPVSSWQDKQNLRAGQNWQDEIVQAIRGTAAFVAVCSPSYFSSVWCRQERITFLERHDATERLDAIRVGDVFRFLKVIKTPADNDLHVKFLPALQHVLFFREEPGAAGDMEFRPGTPEFQGKVREVMLAIASLLRGMRRGREAIYVAASAMDVAGDWIALRNELQAQGYNVRPEALVDATFDRQMLRDEIDRSKMSVHVLGGTYDSFAELQVNLAIGLGRPVLTWMHPGLTPTADPRQTAFLKTISESTALPKGSQRLGGASIRDMVMDLLDLLRPRPDPLPLPEGAANAQRVYLLYDPTTPLDSQFAGVLETLMSQRHLTVFKPDPTIASHSDKLLRHKQFLRESDGVLLYWDGAPVKWLESTMPDVVLAELRLRRPPLAKACLVSDPRPLELLAHLQLAGLNRPQIIRRDDPFDPARLDTFFDSVQKASRTDGHH